MLGERIKGLQSRIYELAGEEFNINSPKQLGEILFVKLAIPTKKKTKTDFPQMPKFWKSLPMNMK